MSRRPWLALLFLPLLAACGNDDAKGGGGASGPGMGSAAGGYGFAGNLGAEVDKRTGDAIQKGKTWLLSKRDEATGAWGSTTPADTRVGYTALGLVALLGATPKESVTGDPTIAKSLEFVVSNQKPDGSVYGNGAYVNYETSAALAALSSARVPKYADAQAKAKDFLAASQIAGGEDDPSYGGFPYKKGQTTDLSNLQFAVQALHDAGLPADSPVFARVRAYLSRVQNRSESNTFVAHVKENEQDVEVVSGNDGGGYYAPGASKVGLVKRPDGKYEAKSYGSMTYALLKCLLYAGVKADDPRVVAALGWLSKNFALDRNPGFEATDDPAKKGAQGHFYYLRTMSRALAELEKAGGKAVTVTDSAGKAHAWRREVAEAIVALQKPDGSWVNDRAERWDEGNPHVATAYALEALATCQGRLP